MCLPLPKKLRTGVYGGSFNPIHLGHTAMAAEIVRRGLVDEMWMVVSPQNPLKHEGLWDDDLRLSLARVATESLDGVCVSDVEFSLPRPSYMINTLETLSARYVDRDFVLVIGMDNWERFHRWYRSGDILQRYPLIVLPRRQESGAMETMHEDVVAGNVVFPDLALIDLSSTWIREQIDNNVSYDGEGLNPRVWEMIKRKKR